MERGSAERATDEKSEDQVQGVGPAPGQTALSLPGGGVVFFGWCLVGLAVLGAFLGWFFAVYAGDPTPRGWLLACAVLAGLSLLMVIAGELRRIMHLVSGRCL